MAFDIHAMAVSAWNRGNPWKATFDSDTRRVTFPDGRSCVASELYAPFCAALDADARIANESMWAVSLKTFEPLEG